VFNFLLNPLTPALLHRMCGYCLFLIMSCLQNALDRTELLHNTRLLCGTLVSLRNLLFIWFSDISDIKFHFFVLSPFLHPFLNLFHVIFLYSFTVYLSYWLSHFFLPFFLPIVLRFLCPYFCYSSSSPFTIALF
jgi:hypothetical protein